MYPVKPGRGMSVVVLGEDSTGAVGSGVGLSEPNTGVLVSMTALAFNFKTCNNPCMNKWSGLRLYHWGVRDGGSIPE
jgi:hypothetical protein